MLIVRKPDRVILLVRDCQENLLIALIQISLSCYFWGLPATASSGVTKEIFIDNNNSARSVIKKKKEHGKIHRPDLLMARN